MKRRLQHRSHKETWASGVGCVDTCYDKIEGSTFLLEIFLADETPRQRSYPVWYPICNSTILLIAHLGRAAVRRITRTRFLKVASIGDVWSSSSEEPHGRIGATLLSQHATASEAPCKGAATTRARSGYPLCWLLAASAP
ncbi:unnamed protein product [Laminaria digitata]